MTYHQENFFKKYEYDLDSSIKKNIFEFCDIVQKELIKINIHKFTVILGNEDDVQVNIVNDSNRKFKQILSLDSIYGTANIFHTTINEVEYSDIPIVFVVGNDLFKHDVYFLKDNLSKFLPENYEIGSHHGSAYLIYTRDFTGQLWNIHHDPFDYKGHLVLTDTNQDFVWHLEKDTFSEKLKKNFFYLFNVKIWHTIMINNYDSDKFRLHVVVDVANKHESSNKKL